MKQLLRFLLFYIINGLKLLKTSLTHPLRHNIVLNGPSLLISVLIFSPTKCKRVLSCWVFFWKSKHYCGLVLCKKKSQWDHILIYLMLWGEKIWHFTRHSKLIYASSEAKKTGSKECVSILYVLLAQVLKTSS